MTFPELLQYAAKYWYVILALIGFAASMFAKRLEPPKGGAPGAGKERSPWDEAEGRRTVNAGAPGEARGAWSTGGGSGMPPFAGGGRPRRAASARNAPAAQQRRELAVPVGDREAASRWDADPAPPVGAPVASAAAARSAAAELRNGPGPHALAQGVLWAEILGPPRAKKPRIR